MSINNVFFIYGASSAAISDEDCGIQNLSPEIAGS
jgi:hypothetical protein